MLSNLLITVSTHFEDAQDSKLSNVTDQALAYQTDFLPKHDDMPDLQFVLSQVQNIIANYREVKEVPEEPVHVGVWFTDSDFPLEVVPTLKVVKDD